MKKSPERKYRRRVRHCEKCGLMGVKLWCVHKVQHREDITKRQDKSNLMMLCVDCFKDWQRHGEWNVTCKTR